MTSLQSDSLIRNNKPSRVMPALFTRMSMVGNSFSNSSDALAMAAPSATSTARAFALPPAAMIAAAVAPQDSADFETQMTVTPCLASVSAMALPMPRPAPVIRAVRLVNVSIFFLIRAQCERRKIQSATANRQLRSIHVPLIALLLFQLLNVVRRERGRHTSLLRDRIV